VSKAQGPRGLATIHPRLSEDGAHLELHAAGAGGVRVAVDRDGPRHRGPWWGAAARPGRVPPRPRRRSGVRGEVRRAATRRPRRGGPGRPQLPVARARPRAGRGHGCAGGADRAGSSRTPAGRWRRSRQPEFRPASISPYRDARSGADPPVGSSRSGPADRWTEGASRPGIRAQERLPVDALASRLLRGAGSWRVGRCIRTTVTQQPGVTPPALHVSDLRGAIGPSAR
jgi:hypothetical protein